MKAKYLIRFIFLYKAGICQVNDPSIQAEDLALMSGDDEFMMENAFLPIGTLDINTASADELALSPFITIDEARAVEAYRKKFGPILDAEELSRIDGFDRQKIRNLKPFIKLDKKPTAGLLNSVDNKTESSVISRYSQVLEQIKGKEDYSGSPAHLFFSTRHQYLSRLRWGLMAEKDPGEDLFSRSNPRGFDHYSAFIQLKREKLLRQIIIGDYQVRLSQGLAFSTFNGSGKSSQVLHSDHAGGLLKPNTSAGEYRFLRGLAGQFEKGSFKLLAFLSARDLDAAISNGKLESAISQSGLHRTAAELSKRAGLRYYTGGISLCYFNRGMSIQQNLIRHEFSAVIPGPKNVYQKSKAYRILVNSSTSLGLEIRNIRIFSELANSFGHGLAHITGFTLHAGHKIFISASYRNYQPDHLSVFTSGFSESSGPVNEQGIYLSMLWQLSRKWTLSVYTDNFSFPWLKYDLDFPSEGSEQLLSLVYKLSRSLNMNLRYRQSQGMASVNDRGINDRTDYSRRSLRIGLEFEFNDAWRWRTRWESNESNSDRGHLLFHELKFKPVSSNIGVVLRYTVFQTDSYQSRIYAYEQDVQGVFLIPAHYGNGSRYYAVINLKLSRYLSLGFKIAQTLYSDRLVIGSGRDAIEGPAKTQVRAQLKLSW